MKTFAAWAGAAALVLGAGPGAPCMANDMTAVSRAGMAVSAQHDASEVGARILREGGNAVDAAVAMGWALAVTHPCCGNVGGGGFMMIHLPGKPDAFIDFREKAPLGASADMYLGPDGKPVAKASLDGWLAVGTPGSVLGLEEARRRYGTMSRHKLMTPAIALARHGFVLQQGDVDVLADGTAAFAAQPNVAAIFLKDGRPFRSGEMLVQADLARTLDQIAAEGPAGFYRGRIPHAVEAASKAGGGVIKAADFAAYTVGGGAPVRCQYRGYEIVSAPPPSSGGVTLCEMLEILQSYPLGQYGYHSAKSVHV
ncbi:MAG TPA: gamma-glutamyltransferase, partial [Caulobacteraceae bacterium]|nr:gamma-glutamyltransferase [Caulobacteraceae bacterium]